MTMKGTSMKAKIIWRSLAAATALVLTPVAAYATVGNQASAPASTTPAASNVKDACGQVSPGYMRCLAKVRTDVDGGTGVRGAAARATAQQALPDGYGPADLQSAYKLPSTGGSNQTIAIVDAFDGPNAEADLAVYRQTYGLPACTSANGCFTKVNQQGATSPLPSPDPGWSVEISLDLDMASAACPQCHIMLVEADDPMGSDLGAAVNTAVHLGASVVSNSYGGPEYNGMDTADYDHPGVPILASSGDAGYMAASAPASLSSVIAVGGTSLTKTANDRGWSEAAWGDPVLGGGAGSGCSAWIAKPRWQHDPYCPTRMVSDVSAVADPNTGLAVYDSYRVAGWVVVGGTSASSPFMAGVIALAGHASQYTQGAQYIYQHSPSHLFDVTTGTNALVASCADSYICNAKHGYDGPTGLGTPDGLGAF